MTGQVSKTQVRRVSCGLIPDQTQKADTIISNIMGYLFDDMQYLLSDPLPHFDSWLFVIGPHPDDFNNFFLIKYLIYQSMLYIYSPGKGTG